jgi:hypothetical protein
VATPVPSIAPLQVVGVCGQTINVLVQGVIVSFTCLPPDKAHEDEEKGGGVDIGKSDLSGGHTALLLESDALDLVASPRDLVPGAEPVVVRVPTGAQVALRDLSESLEQARATGSPVRLEIKSR